MSGPVEITEADLDLTRWIRRGDGVLLGHACGEPAHLIDRMVEQAAEIGELSAFCGLSWREVLGSPPANSIELVSYGTLGALGRIALQHEVKVVPVNFSALPRLFASGSLPGDVALIQVAPPDLHGRCSFGVDATYVADAVAHARIVVAEVNAQMPAVAGASIGFNELAVVVRTDRPVIEAPAAREGTHDAQIADHVVGLIDDGDTIQIGVGSLPDAILRRLHGAADLGVHSGMICEPIADLVRAGVITGARKPVDTGLVVTGAVLGSRALFDFAAECPDVALRPVSYTHRPDVLASVGRLVAINSALEVDLTGQVNSERIGARRAGAVGGQADFLRGATAGGGVGIVALPSLDRRTGASRIVASLSGPVSTSRSDVDVVVTEHGIATLRGVDLERRAAALIGVAAPEHRDGLTRAARGGLALSR